VIRCTLNIRDAQQDERRICLCRWIASRELVRKAFNIPILERDVAGSRRRVIGSWRYCGAEALGVGSTSWMRAIATVAACERRIPEVELPGKKNASGRRPNLRRGARDRQSSL
jgi:uncharacterized protein YfaT (DUF1175 family)